jgi:hypothetical protein
VSGTDTSAKIIRDSVSPIGVRLTTLEVRFWRPILPELNTHRAFSRNSASSRARSVTTTISEVRNNIYIPRSFPTERRGMVGGAPLNESLTISAENAWYHAALAAVSAAEKLVALGVHKSVVNRLLEPFMMHTVVITATDWKNFFDQRLALLPDGQPAADPAMYELAVAMKNALLDSEPYPLGYDEWHLPYITDADVTRCGRDNSLLRQVSVARCAGVSYMTHDREDRDVRDDVRLYQRLRDADPPHWSPFEHVAKPAVNFSGGVPYYFNLWGWKSLRWVAEREEV